MSRSRPRYLPPIGQIVDVQYFARRWKIGKYQYHNALNLLVRTMKRDKEQGIPADEVWWIGLDERGAAKLINLLKLRARHPAMFARHYVSREEYEDLSTRMLRLEEVLAEERKRNHGLAARVRKLENDAKAVFPGTVTRRTG
jgi:hypothetical protein